jgi:uridine kinase
LTLFIGVSGISGSGKTSLCNEIARNFDDVSIISQDRFYKGLPEDGVMEEYNFDEVEAIDTKAITEFIKTVHATEHATRVFNIPIYDFSLHKRVGYEEVSLKNVVLFEGHLVFGQSHIRGLMNKIVYVDVPMDIALVRRLRRDVVSRGRSVEEVLDMYQRFVRKSAIELAEVESVADFVVTNDDYTCALDKLSLWISCALDSHNGLSN